MQRRSTITIKISSFGEITSTISTFNYTKNGLINSKCKNKDDFEEIQVEDNLPEGMSF